MKLKFLTLMFPMLNFGSNSVERSRSVVTMGIQSSDFVHQIAIKALSLMTFLGRTKGKFKDPRNNRIYFLKKESSSPLILYSYPIFENQATHLTSLGGA